VQYDGFRYSPRGPRSRQKHLARLQHHAGQDLFGDWIVAMNYGRIGSRGTTKTVLLSDEEAVRRYVRQCLKKRESAPKRIGIDYKVIQTDGRWEEFIESKHPS
jgi:WGR domain